MLSEEKTWRTKIVTTKRAELAEDALKKTVEGDDTSAEKLAEKAKATNPQAVKDVLQELDEDASSEHDPKRSKKTSAVMPISRRLYVLIPAFAT